MLVVYSSRNEVLVVSKDQEHEMIREYFIESDRDLDDFDREEHNSVLEISSSVRVDS